MIQLAVIFYFIGLSAYIVSAVVVDSRMEEGVNDE